MAFYNQRGTAEHYVKEGNTGSTWTRLSCMRFAANAMRLHLHAPAHNLANLQRTLELPEEEKLWPLTTLRGRPIRTTGPPILIAAGNRAYSSLERPRWVRHMGNVR